MIITIAGTHGSGKSTIAKRLAEKLGFKHYSIGDFMGEIAMERGMTLLELSKVAEKGREVDDRLDEKQINIGKKEDDFVMDARLGWHFIPHSIKIFLKCNLEVAAKRIFNDKRVDEKENTSVEKTIKNIKTRLASEKKRWMEYYEVDPYDESHYDLIIETTDKNIEEICEIILERII